MKKINIVCTLGPATNTYPVIKDMISAGMNVARINMSHGTHEEKKEVIALVRKASDELKTPVAIMIDTKGPEVRCYHPETLTLTAGEQFKFVATEARAGEQESQMSYPGWFSDVAAGDEILIEGGVMRLSLDSLTPKEAVCTVLYGGEMKNGRHVNVRGKTATLPSITEKDWIDLQFGIDQNADFFALSLINDADTLHQVRDFLKTNNGHQELISKIESARSIVNLEEIIEASDGIMVARGDLGAEMPLEDVPALQQQMIDLADQHMKRVIVATQMLESMMENPIPSRAEVADIAHAVEQGVDALMLSGETAIGKYPVETIAMMSSIAERYAATNLHIDFELVPRDALALAAVEMADTITADALIVFSRSGRSANAVAHLDPHTPIHAFTFTPETMRKMVLMRSVTPHSIASSDNYQTTIDAAIEHLLTHKHIQKPYKVVVTSSLLGNNENDMTIQIREEN